MLFVLSITTWDPLGIGKFGSFPITDERVCAFPYLSKGTFLPLNSVLSPFIICTGAFAIVPALTALLIFSSIVLGILLNPFPSPYSFPVAYSLNIFLYESFDLIFVGKFSNAFCTIWSSTIPLVPESSTIFAIKALSTALVPDPNWFGIMPLVSVKSHFAIPRFSHSFIKSATGTPPLAILAL